MFRILRHFALFGLLVGLVAPAAFGQFGGSRAGQGGRLSDVPPLPSLSPEVARAYIAIEGQAELRVAPTEIRIVMAITGEGETAEQCQAATDATVERLRSAWLKMGVPESAIVEDFIAVLPRYEWSVENQQGAEVAVEHRAGYRMQTNLHLAVPDQVRAKAALRQAFQAGVTDIIAFDYWSKDLDAVQQQARQQALAAARGKADLLLQPLLAERPPAINVQEQTLVFYPASLYDSFANSFSEEMTPALRRNMPQIRAPRPQNTYYRGLFGSRDLQPRDLPMKPEISVVSTVRLYFDSPASRKKDD